MDRTPRKSKAFLITFIVVIVLLLGIYFLFRGSGGVFGTKSNGSVGEKIFAPLLGTSKEKKLNTIGNSTGTTGTTAGNTTGTPAGTTTGGTTAGGTATAGNTNGGFGSTTAGNTNGGFGATNGATGGTTFGVVPTFNPLPTPGVNGGISTTTTTGTTGCTNVQGKPIPCGTTTTGTTTSTGALSQCSDTFDNDGDGLADNNDPGCHTDYDANNISSYQSSLNNESRVQTGTTQAGTISNSICPENDPLVFTADESAELEDLLKQYYLIAPTIKEDQDVLNVETDISQNKALIQQVKDLTSDCKAQKADPSYTGPQSIKDNPYYSGGNNSSSYVTGTATESSSYPSFSGTTTTSVNYTASVMYDILEKILNIW